MNNESTTMSSAYAVDVERLLEPIPGENAAGESLRYEGTYDAVQEARREDDPTLPQGVWKTALKSADWTEVEKLCRDALLSRSKDLQLAAWLTEAWTHLRGFDGATAGVEFLAGLCDRFWSELYPPIDGKDLDGRVAPFEWLNDRLALALKKVSITQSGDGSWIDWEAALRHAELDRGRRVGEADDEEESDGRVRTSPKDEFNARVLASRTDFYRQLHSQLRSLKEAIGRLHEVLVEKIGIEAPSTADIEDTVEELSRFVGRILRERDAMEETVQPPTVERGSEPVDDDHAELSGETAPRGLSAGSIQNRAEAYQMLKAAADYLARIEPHSPTPYLVRRAISWGSMSLADLLRELLRDNADLPTVYTLLGIREGRGGYED